MLKPRLVSVSFVAILALCASAALAAKPASKSEARELSFVHMSDTHVDPWLKMPTAEELEKGRSYKVIQGIRELGSVELAPYKLTAPKPSFIVHTGDICEYGQPAFTWDVVGKYLNNLGIPVYLAPGNHDMTWVATPDRFRQMYGGLNHSFDKGGIHFMALCTGSLQDPSPSIGEDLLEFVRNDLKKVSPTTPVIPYFHHPLNGNEFCSRYDVDRLLDILRPYNVPVILDGHGHSSTKQEIYGIPSVMGGSTFSKPGKPTDGFNICYVKGDQISIAYKLANETSATKGLMQKKIPAKTDYPEIVIKSPKVGTAANGANLELSATIKPQSGNATRAWFDLDDDTTGALALSGVTALGSVDLGKLGNGAHFVRVNFAVGGETYSRSTHFYLERTGDAKAVAQWRTQIKGGSKTQPLVKDGKVYVGGNDGGLYALDQKTGKLAWRFDAGAAVATSPAAWKDLVLFGAADGKFYAVNRSGKRAWVYEAGDPIYSAPVVSDDGVAYFGSNNARLHAVNADTGKLVWKNEEASYNVESKPCVLGDHVYFGAWDGNLYCVDRKSGKTLWKTPGGYNQSIKGNLTRYYAPADNGPVATADSVFVADRAYAAGRFTGSGDFVTTISADCSALSLAKDGNHLYLRSNKSGVSKVGFDGKSVWKSDVVAGRIPVSPTEAGDKVYVCTNSGKLNCLDAATGKTLWSYQVTPQLFVMAPVAVDGETAYAVGLDGVVTAIKQAN
ncbi:MAG: PQQ-binding-like beta-propeller repeat protein [Candidatus Sumerlaeaceae bacterium]|nr:PQQ-binding-like beta-propeller repeat protein [Candidatus Sumerlaeaceae bacterium]